MTVTLTVAVARLKLMRSVGVKITLCMAVPALGMVTGVVNAKLPGTDAPAALVAVPPDKVAALNGWPYVMAVTIGLVAMSGVAGLTVTLSVVVAVV